MRLDFARRDEVHVTEAARIVVDDARAALEMEHDMVVRGRLGAVVVEIAEPIYVDLRRGGAEIVRLPIPSPRLRGEGKGEGQFHLADASKSFATPHPNPLPGGERESGPLLHSKRPRHAEMHHERLAGIQIGEQIFGAPPQVLDAPPCQPLREPLGQRKAQVWPPRLDARDAAAQRKSAPVRAGPSRPRAVQAWSFITARNAAPYFCNFASPTP